MRFLSIFLVIILIWPFSTPVKADEKTINETTDVKVEADDVKKEIKVEKEKMEKSPKIVENYSMVPSIVSDSLQLYREEGVEAFIGSVLKGGPLEGDKSSDKELKRLQNVEKYFGKLISHSFINILDMAPYYKRIYIILKFGKGPVFCAIDCYFTPEKIWVVPGYKFDTEVENVFPDMLLKNYFEEKIN